MFILKQLRRKKNISQTDLAQAIGVSLRTIQLYEKKGANIPIKNLTKIAAYFDMNIAELYIHEVNEKNQAYVKNKAFSTNGNICYPLENGSFLMMAPLLFIENQKGYVNNYPEKEMLKHVPQISFIIDVMEGGSYMAFEISGNAMDDKSLEAVPNKSIVLGRKLTQDEWVPQNIGLIQKTLVFVCKDRIFCKRLLKFDERKRTILCHNLNTSPEYQDFEVPLTDIIEVYQLVKKQI
ncbi:MAG: helix-turn-helix transcriptional regulator [Bacteroidota bacterium]